MSHTSTRTIATWLEGLSLQASLELDAAPPQTPEKQIQVQRIGVTGTDSRETSPTDTHFSDIFDSPEPWGWGGVGVKGEEGEGDDEVQTEATSSYGSLDEEDEEEEKDDGAVCAGIVSQGREEEIVELETGEEKSPRSPVVFESAFAENYPEEEHCHEQETPLYRDSSLPHEHQDSHVPQEKRIVRRHDSLLSSPSPTTPTPSPPGPSPKKTHILLTSCLQCTLALLPCSRTLPHCTRCARNGHAALCLAQRRKLICEMVDGDVVGNQEPVLVRVRGEGGRKWEEKGRVYRELLETYRTHLDGRNWVMPSVSTPRGTYRTHEQRLQRLHPGQGMGRLTFAEAELADMIEEDGDDDQTRQGKVEWSSGLPQVGDEIECGEVKDS